MPRESTSLCRSMLPITRQRKGNKYGVAWEPTGLIGGRCRRCALWCPLGLRNHCRKCGSLVCGACQHMERLHVPDSRNPKVVCVDCAPALLNAFGMDPVIDFNVSEKDSARSSITMSTRSSSGDEREPRLDGHWCHSGGSYQLTAFGSEYRFQEEAITGMLTRTGQWYEGALFEAGEQVCSIRLRLQHLSLVSNVRVNRQDDWGPDIIASKERKDAKDAMRMAPILPIKSKSSSQEGPAMHGPTLLQSPSKARRLHRECMQRQAVIVGK